MTRFFVTVTQPGQVGMTLSREARDERALQRALVAEFGEGVGLQWSNLDMALLPIVPRERAMTEADWEAEGARIALESMDLPDGAYFAMAEELGVPVI